MKTAIIYTSKHGTTARVAQMISEGLGKNETELFDLKKNKKIDPSPFEKIIVGGSIHAGAIPKKLHSFLNKNQDILLKKSLEIGRASCRERVCHRV